VPVRATARRSLCTRSRIVGDPTTEISTADVLVYGCSAELMGSVFFLVLEECYGSNNSCCFSHVGSRHFLMCWRILSIFMNLTSIVNNDTW
jgi:hypothetical protein